VSSSLIYCKEVICCFSQYANQSCSSLCRVCKRATLKKFKSMDFAISMSKPSGRLCKFRQSLQLLIQTNLVHIREESLVLIRSFAIFYLFGWDAFEAFPFGKSHSAQFESYVKFNASMSKAHMLCQRRAKRSRLVTFNSSLLFGY
jgi:hypothetical protein